jgi:hypothetical protein
MAILTDARNGIWNAIENWAPLSGVFRRKFKFEKAGDVPAGLVLPMPGDCPAISIFPIASPDGWQTNQTRKTMYTLQVSIFTANLTLPAGEALWEEVVRGIYQSRPGPTQDFYWAASGKVATFTIPQIVPVPVKAGDGEGGPDLMRWDFPVAMQINWNPMTAAN